MRTLKDIIRSYAGIRLQQSHWIAAFRHDIRIARSMGMHHEAYLIEVLLRDKAAAIIGATL